MSETRLLTYFALALAAAGTGAQVMGYEVLGPIFFVLSALFALLALFELRKARPIGVVIDWFDGNFTNEKHSQWPIRELFLYIDSNVLYEGNIRWESIGQEIKDKLAYGMLTAWGRPLPLGTEADEEFDGTPSSPEPIAQAYWSEAEFTYNFFSDSERFSKDVDPPQNTNFKPYADVTVNKSEALSLDWYTKRSNWPDFQKIDDQEQFELHEAACLWFDLKPRLPMPEEAKQLYKLWKEQIENGGMPAEFGSVRLDNVITNSFLKHGVAVSDDGYTPTVTPHTGVLRTVLEGWAQHHGHQPRFLFLERRGE